MKANIIRNLRQFLVCLVATLFFGLNSSPLKAQSWSDVGGGVGDFVNAMTVYNGELIVGGRFTNAGGVPANYIAAWNGTSWHALGSGTDGWVNALTVYNGELIAGGGFSTAGGVTASNIARWDGTAWQDVSGGTNAQVAALTVYNNQLIAGGYFTDAEGIAVNYIGAWDNNGWYPLGSGMGGSQGQVMTLDVYAGELIAAGFFTSAGGNPSSHIAKWNGTSWSTLGTGITWIVYSLCNFNNTLIAGGYYTNAGGINANSIAAWDGSSWSALGSGMGATGVGYDYVFGLATYNGSLFAGGMYLTAGGVTANGIAKWDGNQWYDLNGGVWFGGSNAYGVNALAVYGNELYAGGLFTSAGTVGASHIARWSEPLVGTSESSSGSKEPELSMNPVYHLLQIKFSSSIQKPVGLTLYNLDGKVLRSETFQSTGKDGSLYIDIRNLAPAIYLLRSETGKDQFVQKVFIRN